MQQQPPYRTVMTLMGCVQNYHGLLIARIFLGLAEAGLYPGVAYYLTMWYCTDELAFRQGLFFSAASVAGAFSGLLVSWTSPTSIFGVARVLIPAPAGIRNFQNGRRRRLRRLEMDLYPRRTGDRLGRNRRIFPSARFPRHGLLLDRRGKGLGRAPVKVPGKQEEWKSHC